MKKLLSILFTLVLLLGLLPGTALAATIISSVYVTLDAPVIGAAPDYTAILPSGAHYFSDANNTGDYRNNIRWWDVTDWTAVDPDGGVFQAGHQYEVEVWLMAENGYAFNSSTNASLNGKPAGTQVADGQLSVIYSFPALTQEIASVDLTLDAPTAGAHPDYTAGFPAGAHYYSEANNTGAYRNDIRWRDNTDSYYMDPEGGVFQAGHVYQVEVFLTAEDSYTFTSAITATLNGQTAQAAMSFGQLKVTYTFPALPQEIPWVAVTLDEPAAGAHPDYTAAFPAGAHYYSEANNTGTYRNYIRWWDNTDSSYLDPDDGVFQIGHEYTVLVFLTAEEGYAFTDATTASLNGRTAQPSMSGKLLRVYYSFPVLTHKITSVDLTLDAPAVGAHPDYTATFPDGAHYYSAQYNGDTTRNDIRWWDNTDGTYMDPDNGVFQAWHQYEVQIWLTAEDGYAFANSTTATLNGQTALAMSGSQLRVAYTFEQICTVSGSVSGNKLTYTVAGAPAGAVLIASRYDGGRMTWVQMVASPGAAGTLTVGGSGSVYKLMLVDGSSFLPLCPAWIG